MNFDYIEKINFGNKYFNKYSGVAKTIRNNAITLIVLILLAIFYSGWLRILFSATAVIPAFFLFYLIKNRSGQPWREYHYPLMIFWSGAEGAAHSTQNNNFDFKSEFFLNLVLKDMSKDDMKKLISLSKFSTFDAMLFLGCLNSEKSVSSPEMIEFKRLIELAQNESKEKFSINLLFALIMYKFIGKKEAAKYFMKATHGEVN